MPKIVSDFRFGDFLIIVLDKVKSDFNKVEIDGIIYDVIIPYDIPNAIAIKTEDNIMGKSIKFIQSNIKD